MSSRRTSTTTTCRARSSFAPTGGRRSWRRLEGATRSSIAASMRATRSRSAAFGSSPAPPRATRRSTSPGRSSTEDADAPSAVLTGGSLLVGSAGRTDLLGRDATDELTGAQYRSLRALATPARRGRGAADPRARQLLYRRTDRWEPDLDDRDSNGEPTRYSRLPTRRPSGLPCWAVSGRFRRITARWLRSTVPDRRSSVGQPCLTQLDPAAFARAIAAGAHVVDGRPRGEFAAGHLPGALNVELDDSFASYVGWFVPFGAELALVLPDPLDDSLRGSVRPAVPDRL